MILNQLNNQEVRKTKAILKELIEIKRELQVIRKLLESSSNISVNGYEITRSVQKAIRDTFQEDE